VKAAWRSMKQRWQGVREVVLPTSFVIAVVIGLRWIGLLQIHEWMLFDYFSRLCPTAAQSSPVASQVVIVGIDEIDLAQVGSYPVSDRVLAQALQNLAAKNPSVIGLNLFRNLPVEPGHADFAALIPQLPNLVGTEVALNVDAALNIKPAPEIPPERVGFADVVVDTDGRLRRALLASPNWEGKVKYSLALRLAQLHLTQQGIEFQHGRKSSDPLRFGSVVLPRFQADSGGYIRADANGNQMLLNFCGNGGRLPVLSLRDVLSNNFSADIVRNRVVLVGMTASSVKDIFFTSALRETMLSRSTNSGEMPMPSEQLIYDVEVNAQTVHQIVSAVVQNRPLIHVVNEFWEYIWILGWGWIGVTIRLVSASPWKTMLGVAAATGILLGGGFLLLNMVGLWLPIVPALLTLCGAGLVTVFFDRALRFELVQRRQVIEQTYEAVHNGPLQQLAVILRSLDDRELSPQYIDQQLRSLNEDLRGIFERMRQEVSVQSEQLYLRGDFVLDLRTPLPELLYQVYNYTRGEDLPGFELIRTFVPPNFEPLQPSCRNLHDRRGLCLFLQEALFNVGKHAIGSTRLDIRCSVEGRWYCLQIIDNGPGIATDHSQTGQGTRQAQTIATQLQGEFTRYEAEAQGTICELRWRVRQSWFQPMQRYWNKLWWRS
jgi:CHASE2 domain-containing sensor protein